MKNLARISEPAIVSQEYGYVVKAEESNYKVETDTGIIEAHKAFSCLVQPKENDKVLVCLPQEGDAYILAVLERENQPNLEIAHETGIQFSTGSGSIVLDPDEGLALRSSKNISLESTKFKGKFSSGELSFHKFLVAGQALEATLTRIKAVAHVVETIAERVQQTIKNSYKTVEESEFLNAGAIHHIAKKMFNLRGRYTVITARKDVKINGKHIHMG